MLRWNTVFSVQFPVIGYIDSTENASLLSPTKAIAETPTLLPQGQNGQYLSITNGQTNVMPIAKGEDGRAWAAIPPSHRPFFVSAILRLASPPRVIEDLLVYSTCIPSIQQLRPYHVISFTDRIDWITLLSTYSYYSRLPFKHLLAAELLFK